VRTTLLTGGLPFHRRLGVRKLDTLLSVRGETARSFRLGIGIDLPHPVAAALDFLSPPVNVASVPMPSTPSGWLFHLDSRHVLATHWEAVTSAGRLAGFRVRLLETDGRKVGLGLNAFRTVQSARKVHPGDAAPADLVVENGRIIVPLGPHEWAEVEADFSA
jgi:alpha-mannosidase